MQLSMTTPACRAVRHGGAANGLGADLEVVIGWQ